MKRYSITQICQGTKKTIVHFEGVIGGDDVTLCGLVTSGDVDNGLEDAILSNERVDCADCVRVVQACKHISPRDYNIIFNKSY